MTVARQKPHADADTLEGVQHLAGSAKMHAQQHPGLTMPTHLDELLQRVVAYATVAYLSLIHI